MADFKARLIDKSEFSGARAVRERVFCDEQGFAHAIELDEYDEFPDTVRHIAVFDDGKIIATGRVINEGNGKVKLGRIAVDKEYRGTGVGSLVVRTLIEVARVFEPREILIDSQLHAIPFYERLGFKAFGEEHPDGHVMHKFMRLDKDRYYIFEKSCGAVVYTIADGKRMYLVEKMQKGHLSLCKGHVENNETEIETATREISEETGLAVQIDTNFREVIEYSPYAGCKKEVVFFVALAESTQTVAQPEEVNSILWLTLDEALEKLTFDADKNTLKKADEYLK